MKPLYFQTGFPFDDTEYNSSDSLQSTLNNIAQRHPEFADHLNLDNFGSWRRKRNTSGSSTDREDPRFHTSGHSSRSFDIPDNRRFAEHSFPSGFNRFPFTQHFDDFTDDLRTEEKPPEVPRTHVNEKRSRKVQNPNLPQHLSNTVDLGQKQAPVEENRGQRSMSAPPEHRTGHSSYNTQGRNMGSVLGSKPSGPPPQQAAPKERIIPIQVEGRDEPVVPKNIHINPQTDYEPNHVNQHQHQQTFSSRQHNVPPHNVPQHNVPPQNAPQHNAPASQHGPATRQTTPPAQQKPAPRQVPVQKEQEPPSVNLNDPLEKIKSVKADVLDLMHQVETFNGARKDKHYIYLDEMLTRNLLKLDNIETDGKDNIRLARREAIKCIQETISSLEAKAQAWEKQSADMKSSSSSSVPETDEPKKYKSEVKMMMKTPSVSEDDKPEFPEPTADQVVEAQQTEVDQTVPMEVDKTASSENTSMAATEGSQTTEGNTNVSEPVPPHAATQT